MMRERWLAALLFAGVVSCTTAEPVDGVVESKVGGIVSVGAPVAGATVSIYDPGDLDTAIHQTVADDGGVFDASFQYREGTVFVCATGGSFADLATAVPSGLAATELCALVADISSEDPVVVSPWTELDLTYATALSSLTGTRKWHQWTEPQHFLYFLPLPQGQGSFRPILRWR